MVAVFISTAVASSLAALYILVTRQPIAWSAVAALPWYLWFAGLIGFFFVLGTMWLAPILGAALLFAAVVAGQMIGATICGPDRHRRLSGPERRSVADRRASASCSSASGSCRSRSDHIALSTPPST